MKHKHAELIKAWEDGVEIECRIGEEQWTAVAFPSWSHFAEYRIKPTPKPDLVVYGLAHTAAKDVYAKVYNISESRAEGDNLKLTFDGETGKLKSAEVINSPAQ